jgi:hypothetical protein
MFKSHGDFIDCGRGFINKPNFERVTIDYSLGWNGRDGWRKENLVMKVNCKCCCFVHFDLALQYVVLIDSLHCART